MATSKKRTTTRKTTRKTTTKRKSTSSRTTKADLEAKIAQLEKRLSSLAEAPKPAPKEAPKPAPKEAPKPAEAKKAEAKTEDGGGPHAHDEKPAETKTEATKETNADKAKDEYIARMAKKGATLPKGFIKDAKANTGH